MSSYNTKIIAMAGKGGTGKTTFTALLVRYLVNKALTPVLAVDADANANLNELLGLDIDVTLGEIRDQMKTQTPVGMTKNEYMELRINQAIIEAKGFDLVVMGQPEGPGCYCMANAILAQVMDRLKSNYRYMLVDNEAGMEHLSRLNLRNIYTLFVVSDASIRGINAAVRISNLTSALSVDVFQKVLVVNKAPKEIPDALMNFIDKSVKESDLEFGGFIPLSDKMFECEINQIPVIGLDDNVDAVASANKIFDNYLIN